MARMLATAGLAILFAVVPVPAQAATERPRVYVVVIDGLDPTAVDAGRAPFISSLLRGEGARSTHYRESRAVMIAETNPNHVAMMTGAYTAASGVDGNRYALYAPLASSSSCRAVGPVDESKLPVRTTGESAECITAQTLFESIKRQGNPDDLVTAALFGKVKLGRLFNGRRVDPGKRDVDYLWAPCAPSSTAEEREYCANVPIDPIPGVQDRTLDDTLVMDQMLRTIRQGVSVGGRQRRPDLTFVNLPQVDNAGHISGINTPNPGGPPLEIPGGGELRYQQAVGLADQEIQRLVTELRSRGEWGRSVLILLSDHGHDSGLVSQKIVLTDAFRQQGIAENRVLVSQDGNADNAYLANRKDPNRFALLARMRQVALQTPGVMGAYYREPNPLDGGRALTLDGAHPDWHAASERSGDLVIFARPGFYFSEPRFDSNIFLGNHGAPYTRHSFFAVISGGDAVQQRSVGGSRTDEELDDTADNPGQSENVDVAPTVLGLFGLSSSAHNQGRWLGDAFDRAKLAGVAKPVRAPKLRLRRLTKPKDKAERSGPARCSTDGTRYRVSWRTEGVYDLTLRGSGGGAKPATRKLLTRSRLQSVVFRAKPGRSYTLTLQRRAASGVAGKASKRSLTASASAC